MVTAMPRLLKQQKGFDEVAVCIMEHNKAVFENNPFVDEVHVIPPDILDQQHWVEWR